MEGHSIQIEDRNRLTVTAVADVENFSEEVVLMVLKQGGLLVKGTGLHIQKLDLTEGKVIISGSIRALSYTEKAGKGEGSFLSKILK